MVHTSFTVILKKVLSIISTNENCRQMIKNPESDDIEMNNNCDVEQIPIIK